MLIAFEGIDGSGKTTLSNALAKRLKKHGVSLFHARENGELSSAISSQIRLLTQNPQNFELTSEAEFLLYAARETQLLEEAVRPHLTQKEWVICDRSLYTSLVLGAYGRRLERGALEGILTWASKGLWPDLVFFCDVPINTSRVRKKLQKILDKKTGGGRKGIAGLGLRMRLREGYVALAKENPDKWIYIDTNRMSPDEALEFAWAKLAPILNISDVPTPAEPLPAPSIEPGHERSLQERYFKAAEAVVARDSRLASYLLNGFETTEAYAIRERLWQKEPALIAYGLSGIRSEEAMELRLRLAEREPHYTAYSLRGTLAPFKEKERVLAPEQLKPTQEWRSFLLLDPINQKITEQALALWRNLALRAPKGVAASLQGPKTLLIPELWEVRRLLLEREPDSAFSTIRGVNLEEAWELRRQGKERSPTAVLRSLAHLDTEEAWALRRELFPRALPIDRLDSLVGLSDERAFSIRTTLGKEAPLEALASIRGLSSPEAFALRERYFRIAPKIVIQGIGALLDERSWYFREQAAEDVIEVLESIRGFADERSVLLREAPMALRGHL
jgi:dTMP kinase